MDREYLAHLLEGISREDDEARRELLEYIARQPAGIQALAYEALEDGGEDTYEQLLLTLGDDPALYIRSARPPMHTAAPTGSAQEQPVNIPAPRKGEIPTMLITTLRTGERSARVSAARTLADYGGDAAPYLVEAIKSDERHVMGAAAEALQSLGGAATSAVLPLTGDSDEQRRWHAYKVLSATADRSAVPALIAGLESGNSGIRWLAGEGLAHVGREALAPMMQRLTGEKISAWLRNGVIHALNKTHWANDNERDHYKRLANEIKVAPLATLAHIARRELDQPSTS